MKPIRRLEELLPLTKIMFHSSDYDAVLHIYRLLNKKLITQRQENDQMLKNRIDHMRVIAYTDDYYKALGRSEVIWATISAMENCYSPDPY